MPRTSDRLPTQQSRNRTKFKTPPQSIKLTSSTSFNTKRERRTPPDKITHLNINGGFRTDGDGWPREGFRDGDRVKPGVAKVECQGGKGRSPSGTR